MSACIERRVKVRVVGWEDPVFLAAVNAAVARAAIEQPEIDSWEAAERAQAALRSAGYPSAEVRYWRTVDEALDQLAHWTVTPNWRAGPLPGEPLDQRSAGPPLVR